MTYAVTSVQPSGPPLSVELLRIASVRFRPIQTLKMNEYGAMHGKRSRSGSLGDGPQPEPASGAADGIIDDDDDELGPMPMPNTGGNDGPRKKRKGVCAMIALSNKHGKKTTVINE